jgi:hypothetical protein
MLALYISIVVLPVLALVFYVVRKSQPGRFRLSVKLLKLLDIVIEVDAQASRMSCRERGATYPYGRSVDR